MNTKKSFTSAILLAGGDGQRMGAEIAKQWTMLCGKSVILRCIERWLQVEEIDEIVLVIRKEDEDLFLQEMKPFLHKIKYVFGGKNRAESAKNGFGVISEKSEYVAIADVARCLILPDDIRKVLSDAYQYGAASAVCAVSDTVKEIHQGVIGKTIPREELLLAQTPQIFRAKDYKKALLLAQDLSRFTDDNMLMEQIGVLPHPTYLSGKNPKLTNKEDVALFEAMIRQEEYMRECIRVGHGYDAHRFCEGRPLILGGVEIPFEYGLLGHSDADVLLHAIMDAILGAMGLGDIGRHFPDSDEQYRGISSLRLLLRVKELMEEKCATLINLDATIVIQKPKIAPYINIMVENIAFALSASPSCINIKATTEEGMGFTGRMEGVSANAVCLLTMESK